MRAGCTTPDGRGLAAGAVGVDRALRLLMAVAAPLALLVACGGGGPSGLQDREWFLVALGDPDEPTPTDPTRPATATFADGLLSGRGPCNEFRASYRLAGDDEPDDTLSIGDVASTRALCGDAALDDQETRYLSYLPIAVAYTVEDDTLRIDTARGPVLVFHEEAGGG